MTAGRHQGWTHTTSVYLQLDVHMLDCPAGRIFSELWYGPSYCLLVVVEVDLEEEREEGQEVEKGEGWEVVEGGWAAEKEGGWEVVREEDWEVEDWEEEGWEVAEGAWVVEKEVDWGVVREEG